MANSGTGNPIITAALAKLAILRQATGVSDLVLDLYSAELEAKGITPDVVVIACYGLQDAPRAEGETAFPSFGTVLERCRMVRAGWEAQRAEVEARQLEGRIRSQPSMTREESKAFIERLKRDVAIRREEIRAEKAGR